MSSNYPPGAENHQDAPFNEPLEYDKIMYMCGDCAHIQESDQYCENCQCYDLDKIYITN